MNKPPGPDYALQTLLICRSFCTLFFPYNHQTN